MPPPEVPRPSRADVEALAGPITEDEWEGCVAVCDREAPAGIEVTARYLAWVVGRAREDP